MSDAKLKKLARLAALEDAPAVTTALEIERLDSAIEKNQNEIIETQEGVIKVLGAVAELDSKKANRDDVQKALDSIPQIIGPRGFKGDKGDNYLLTENDKQKIAESIKVPVVEKIVERIETIKEQPIIKTEVIKEITLKEDLAGEAIVSKINSLPLEEDKKIGAEHIKGLPQAMSKHYPVGVSEVRVKALIDEKVKENDATHDTLQGVTDRGATTDNIITVPGVQFDIAATPVATAEGLLQWNPTDGTLDLGMDGGAITGQLFQELFTKVRNAPGYQTITNGQAVYISGRTGPYPDVRLAQSNADATSRVLGVATQDIASPDFGFITTAGYVRGIKTNYTGTGIWGTTWVTGDLLYVSKTNAGVLTNVEPAAPHHSDVVGTVGIVHGTLGSILITLDRHRTLEELTDVNGTPLTTTGQFPMWNQTTGYFDFNYNFLLGKITTVTDTYNILTTDQTVVCNKATAFTVTLPTAVVGQKFSIKNIGAGSVTVDGAGTDLIDGQLTQTLSQWSAIILQCSSANTWIIL